MKAKLKIIIPMIIAVTAVIIAAICIKFTPKAGGNIESMLTTAQKYLVEMNYEQAIAEFNKIIELDPMNADAYLGLAQAYIDMGDTESAVETLKKGFDMTGDERLGALLEKLLGEAAQTETSTVSETAELDAKPMEPDIPEGALSYGGHSYYVFSNVCNTWEEAEEYCESLGGYLAVINDEEENTAVYDIMFHLGYESAYFGYTDKEEDGRWKWVGGRNSDYSNWNEYEPSDGFYAMFYWKWKYTWNDGTFDDKTDNGGQTFICEWEIPVENTLPEEKKIVIDRNEPFTITVAATEIIRQFHTYCNDDIFYNRGKNNLEYGFYKMYDMSSGEKTNESVICFKNYYDILGDTTEVISHRDYYNGRLVELKYNYYYDETYNDYRMEKYSYYASPLSQNIYIPSEKKLFGTDGLRRFSPSPVEFIWANLFGNIFSREENSVYYFEAPGMGGINAEITLNENDEISEIAIPTEDITFRFYYDDTEQTWLLYYEYTQPSAEMDERLGEGSYGVDAKSQYINYLPYYIMPYDKGVIYPTIEGLPEEFDKSVFDIPENSANYTHYSSWEEITVE